jgi:hypothetical protein
MASSDLSSNIALEANQFVNCAVDDADQTEHIAIIVKLQPDAGV